MVAKWTGLLIACSLASALASAESTPDQKQTGDSEATSRSASTQPAGAIPDEIRAYFEEAERQTAKRIAQVKEQVRKGMDILADPDRRPGGEHALTPEQRERLGKLVRDAEEWIRKCQAHPPVAILPIEKGTKLAPGDMGLLPVKTVTCHVLDSNSALIDFAIPEKKKREKPLTEMNAKERDKELQRRLAAPSLPWGTRLLLLVRGSNSLLHTDNGPVPCVLIVRSRVDKEVLLGELAQAKRRKAEAEKKAKAERERARAEREKAEPTSRKDDGKGERSPSAKEMMERVMKGLPPIPPEDLEIKAPHFPEITIEIPRLEDIRIESWKEMHWRLSLSDEAFVVEALPVERYRALYQAEKLRRQEEMEAVEARRKAEEEARRKAEEEAKQAELRREAPLQKLKKAKLYIDNGLRDQARRTLESLIREYPDSEPAREARQLLQKILRREQ